MAAHTPAHSATGASRGASAADARRVEPARAAGAFAYEDADIPDGVTLGAWRRHRTHRHARRHRVWLRAWRDPER
jgi:hypothetical protein